MLAHLALATALAVAATHLAPPLLDSRTRVSDSPAAAVILTAPDTKAREPGRCPPAGGQPVYRDLSDRVLIPVAPRTPLGHPGAPS